MKVGRRQAFEAIDRVLADAGTEGLNGNLKVLHLALELELQSNPIEFFKKVIMPLCADTQEVDIYDKEVWEALTPVEQAEAMNEMTSDYERYKQDKDKRAAAKNETVDDAAAAVEPAGVL